LQHINFKYFIYFFCIVFASTEIKSQEEPLSKEVKLQNDFIEAFRLEQIGKPEKAIEILEKLSYEPTAKSTAKYQLARLYEKEKKPDQCITAINESIQADPKNKWLYIYKANVLQKYGNYNQLAECYLSLTKLEPTNYTFYDNAAISFMKDNQLDKTMAILDEAQKKFGNSPSIAIKKSNLFVIQKKEKKAIETLENSIKEYPYHTELYPELILLLEKNNLIAKAKEYEINLAKYDQGHPFLQKNISQSNQNTPSIETVQQQIINSDINLDQKIKLIIPILQNYVESKDPNLKIELTNFGKSILNQYPNDAKSYALQGDIYFHSSEYELAKESYITAISKTNVPYSVFENLLYTTHQLESWNTQEQFATKALDYYPNQSYPFYMLAEAQYHLESYDDAILNSNQVILMIRNNPSRKSEAYTLYGKILSAKKDPKAAEIWNKSIESEASPSAIIEHHLYQLSIGNTTHQNDFEKAINSKDITSFTKNISLAKQYYANNKYQDAIELLKKNIEVKEFQRPSYYILLAQNLLKIENKTEAKKYLQQALLLSESKTKIQKWISELN